MERVQKVLNKIKLLEVELNSAKIEYSKINDTICRFTDEISLINSRRERLWSDLKKLHDFFEDLGNISEIKYSNFKKELSIPREDNLDILVKINSIENIKKELKELKIHGFREYLGNGAKYSVFGGIIGLGIGVKKSYNNNTEVEKKLENYLSEVEKIKMSLKNYKENLDLKRDYITMCESITIEYRYLINEISDFLEKNVFSELEMVKLFLLAHSIKDKVLNKDLSYETDIFPTKISSLSETIYRKHYLFIENIFLLFEISQSFFSQDIITKLINFSQDDTEENNINRMVQVELQIKSLKNQKDKVSENIIYGGE